MNFEGCERAEEVCAHTLGSPPAGEVPALAAHLAACPACSRELETLQPVLDSLLASLQDVLQPAPSLQARLAGRIAIETGTRPALPAARRYSEPPWEEVAPGICCKILAADDERYTISMLVRLAPGSEYPPHTHAGVEELYLLDGEVWIDERKLCPGEYSLAHPGTTDERVWSETGCTCVLITSPQDALR